MPAKTIPQTDGELPQTDFEEAEHASSNLQELAQCVKAEVGAHSSKVEDITPELNAQQSLGSSQEADVLEATRTLSAHQHLKERLLTAELKLEQQAEQIQLYAAHALTDVLTTLGNRRALDAELLRRTAEFQRHGTPYSLLMIDVDHFKKLNDLHGHLAGDEVLRLIAHTLKTTIRASDFVARYGGEEFAVVMPHTTLSEAAEGAQRLRSGVEQAVYNHEGCQLNVTISIGVAEISAGQDPSTFVQCADEALYAAKQAGRNQAQRHRKSPPPATPAPNSQALRFAVEAGAAITSANTPLSALITNDGRTDNQTGLPNRTAFCEDIRRRLSEAQRHGNRLSLMFVRIDSFDALASRHGAAAADLILRTCVQFLSSVMREMDFVARYQTDVFGIILPGTTLAQAAGAGDRLRVAIECCPVLLADKNIRFTVSAGVAEAQPGEDLVSFITRTEAAKTAACRGGGNKIRCHNGLTVEAPSQPVAANS
ncbi:MAG TPA: GGDEF domain-containing protein [Pirellulales bacterium]|nr:GGDEF domain-containing protein [Pirellulales bacterium]